MSEQRYAHAVVVGSGIAGLVTARVLSEHFARVTVLERDAEPEGAAPRDGVPQSRHYHALLPGGLRVLAELLPGLPEELESKGSLQPGPSEFYFLRPEGKSYLLSAYMPEPPPDDGSRPLYVQSRGLLEHCIRRRVRALPNVEIRYRATVEDICARDGAACGVRLVDGHELECDLVIDAAGRGGRILHWLDRLGFDRPAENVVHCDFAYTSVLMRPRTPDVFRDVGFFVIAGPGKRAGALVRLEHGVWLANVTGRYGDYPPHDLPGFLDYAASLGQPYFTDLLAQADAITQPAAYRFAKSRRRRFDQLARFPEGLLPIGDSLCHFNPVYGQGMSAACRQALALQRSLAQRAARGEPLLGLWRAFLPEAYRETRAPWLFAALSDFRHPRCQGDFPSEEADTIALLRCVLREAAAGDRDAMRALRAVQGLVAPLESLREPPWPERLAAHSAA
jgi:2-polyprenyl-6-methoxyphenol hydroxylase-like FAD-dependent oxidoreductase